jgi:hypothetical protein
MTKIVIGETVYHTTFMAGDGKGGGVFRVPSGTKDPQEMIREHKGLLGTHKRVLMESADGFQVQFIDFTITDIRPSGREVEFVYKFGRQVEVKVEEAKTAEPVEKKPEVEKTKKGSKK